ncbi:hypothetical protein LRS10_18195 [Phenylobacterium sp. J426]|nr:MULTISPECIES: hypothetical protein [unclassified Phenylobacterium]MCR5875913.1 hypothetical protein [Phenylobacterium sp. J426]MCR5880205.1 hypothetical protein [Phenylobacterium sp. J367]
MPLNIRLRSSAGELDEDPGDDVARRARPSPPGQVGKFAGDLDTATLGEPSRLLLRSAPSVDKDHLKTLLRQPHAIPTLSVRHRQSADAGRQPMPLAREKGVGLLHEQVALLAVASVPTTQPRIIHHPNLERGAVAGQTGLG